LIRPPRRRQVRRRSHFFRRERGQVRGPRNGRLRCGCGRPAPKSRRHRAAGENRRAEERGAIEGSFVLQGGHSFAWRREAIRRLTRPATRMLR
jgi:hypothetical protein